MANEPNGQTVDNMAATVTQRNPRADARIFVLEVLHRAQRAFSLAEVVRLAATSGRHVSADDARAAAAALVEAGEARLTEDLQLRIVQK